jgi:hypothetical protein
VPELKRVIFMNGEMFFISSKKSNQQEKNLKQAKNYLAIKKPRPRQLKFSTQSVKQLIVYQ